MQRSALKTEEVATGKGLQAASQSWKGKEMVSYLDPPEALAETIILAQWDSYQTSDFQNHKIINLCGLKIFKPLSLW